MPIAQTRKYDFGDKMTQKMMRAIMAEALKIPGAIISQSPIQGQSVVSASFKSKAESHDITLPEPNPVLIYLKISIENFHLSVQSKKEFLQTNTLERQTRYLKFIDFFEKATISVTFLAATIEAFINQRIADDFTVVVDEQELNKNKIEWKDIKTKIKHIMPVVDNISFHTQYPNEYNLVTQLFKLRNSLIHLKTNNLSNKTAYEELLKSTFDADIESYINAIIKFLNTTVPNLVEEKK